PPARPPAATASSWTWAATATRRRPSPRTRSGRCPVPRWPPRSPGRSSPSPGGASRTRTEPDAPSENGARCVLGGLGVLRGDLLHLPDDLGHLRARGAGERQPVREQRVQPRPVQRDPLV